MKARISFYLSSLFLMITTMLILATQDAKNFLTLWVISVVVLFITLPFYVIAIKTKKNPYEIDELQTIVKAEKTDN